MQVTQRVGGRTSGGSPGGWSWVPPQRQATGDATRRESTGIVLPLAPDPDELGARLAEREEQLHELRSTLAGVVSAVRLLAHQGGLLSPERARQLAGTLDAELDRVERLLDPARRTGPASLCLDGVVSPVVEARRAAGQQVEWAPSGALVRGRGDEIAQVIGILLVNAARHAPGSPVRIDVADVGDDVHVVVSDEGPGIPVELHERVLQRGGRGPHSSGEGLGLYVANRLLRELGGTLRILPSERGAVFDIALPSGDALAAS